jgi:hypothetical protein
MDTDTPQKLTVRSDGGLTSGTADRLPPPDIAEWQLCLGKLRAEAGGSKNPAQARVGFVEKTYRPVGDFLGSPRGTPTDGRASAVYHL